VVIVVVIVVLVTAVLAACAASYPVLCVSTGDSLNSIYDGI
jgi:hypothetical protein